MEVLKQAKVRTEEDKKQLSASVEEIITHVREKGDEALKEYCEKFDGSRRHHFHISREEIEEAYTQLKKQEIQDIQRAVLNIRAFAQAQKDSMKPLADFSPMPGIYLGHRIIPVDSCCCYVPGGNYPLYSTALMLITPAKVAGVKRVTACSPVMKGTDKINPRTLVAMDLAGADEIYAVGGAQAVAAFAYGTEEIPAVDMIVGPGNRYVTEAKRQCYGQVGIDFVAGPSEVLILADQTANPKIIAADILAQSEHDRNAKGILVTTDRQLGLDVIQEVELQLETLATRDIARDSWREFGEVLVTASLDEAVETANAYAPEHLEVHTAQPKNLLGRLRNYGSLFLGENTAEVFGDYASGTNHTLPTLRASRYTGGVWAGTFLKVCTYQSMSTEASKKISPLVSRLAMGEGLEGHAKAALARSEKAE